MTNTPQDVTRIQTRGREETVRREDDSTRLHAGSSDPLTAPTVINTDVTDLAGAATKILPGHLLPGQSRLTNNTKNTTQTNPYGYGEGHRIAPKPGARVLRGRFELQEPPLGSGGMGDVFLARDLLRVEMQDSNPFVALKLLNEACRQLPGALQALQREAKKAQTLSHPNIVTVYDFDRDGDDAFITMEYLKGYSLKDHLRKFQKLSFADGRDILERIARGLAYAHQEGFVHADIKPANIYLAENNSVKILDLGIAQAFNEAYKEAPSAADELTKNALTPAYASVEMLAGESAMPADDVYALACVAYEIFAGKHPFVDAKGRAIPANEAKALGLLPPLIPGMPKRQMLAIKKALAFDRAHRFANAGAFIDAIKARNRKKDFILLSSAVLATGFLIFVINLSLQAVVPSIDSLSPPLAEVAKTLREADSLLAAGDIAEAHNLYAQSWEVSNQTPDLDPGELDKARAIIRDRINTVAEDLIQRSREPNIDEYRLRELGLALASMLKDEITDEGPEIQQALEDISARLPKK